MRSTRWATPRKGPKAGGTRGAAARLALVVLSGAALLAPSAARADAHMPQWSKARKDRQAVLAVQGDEDSPSNQLKWRKPHAAAGSPSSMARRAVGGDEPDEPSIVVLTKATEPVKQERVENPFLDDEPTDEPAPKLRLLAVDDDEGELVPIAVDDEPETDDPSEDLPALPKRRPLQPTDIDAGESRGASIGDDYAMGPTEPEPRCPTVKDLRPIGEITNDIAPEPGRFPQECPLAGDPYKQRNFAATNYTWKASALCHKPLYFEQPQMERYGHTFGPVVQPIFSGVHFFVSVLALPYKMGVEPPLECIYALGYYRPGSCAPRTVGPIPISARGALSQLGVSTGLTYLFP
ncbi:MAG TPA: hypothetical protein VMV69_06620 [Pirellulales bacterium]|nr:hypothetical protein [Pirellulales bacterium]